MSQTRKDDERLLDWMDLRKEGVSAKNIAEAYNVTRNSVIGALDRIKKAEPTE